MQCSIYTQKVQKSLLLPLSLVTEHALRNITVKFYFSRCCRVVKHCTELKFISTMYINKKKYNNVDDR